MGVPAQVVSPLEGQSRYLEIPLKDDSIPIKAYYKNELANLFGVSRNTFAAWIIRLEPYLIEFGYYRHAKILSPKQVQIIVEKLGG